MNLIIIILSIIVIGIFWFVSLNRIRKLLYVIKQKEMIIKALQMHVENSENEKPKE